MTGSEGLGKSTNLAIDVCLIHVSSPVMYVTVAIYRWLQNKYVKKTTIASHD